MGVHMTRGLAFTLALAVSLALWAGIVAGGLALYDAADHLYQIRGTI